MSQMQQSVLLFTVMRARLALWHTGVPHIKPTSNPATWMLEISTVSAEERAGADLAQVYQHSNLCRCLPGLTADRNRQPQESPLAGFRYLWTCNFKASRDKRVRQASDASCSLPLISTTRSLARHEGLRVNQLQVCQSEAGSHACRNITGLVDRLSQPEPGSQPLAFESEHAQSLFGQYCVLLRKGTVSYWRNPGYNAVRFTFTVMYGLLMGAAFWALGSNRHAPRCSAHHVNKC